MGEAKRSVSSFPCTCGYIFTLYVQVEGDTTFYDGNFRRYVKREGQHTPTLSPGPAGTYAQIPQDTSYACRVLLRATVVAFNLADRKQERPSARTEAAGRGNAEGAGTQRTVWLAR